MTDDDWFNCHPFGLAKLLFETDLNESKHWLFAARCLERTLDWVAHPLLPDIITICYRLGATPDEPRLVAALENLSLDILPNGWLDDVPREFFNLRNALSNLLDSEGELWWFAHHCAATLDWCGCGCEGFDAEHLYQLDILRDLVPPPSALPWDDAWETETVLLLASLIKNRAEFSLSPVFADALEDAGCGCPTRLAYLRSESASHGPGCWALAPNRTRFAAVNPLIVRENALFHDYSALHG